MTGRKSCDLLYFVLHVFYLEFDAEFVAQVKIIENSIFQTLSVGLLYTSISYSSRVQLETFGYTGIEGIGMSRSRAVTVTLQIYRLQFYRTI